MPGPLQLEAIVLRSIRTGEADRVLHLLTLERGRVGAIAKGVRRARSRFGGRLEPFGRVRLMLHEGRSDLMTVTGADAIDPHPRLREHGGALGAAGRACEAVLRLTEEGDPGGGGGAVYHLLGHELRLLDARPADAGLRNQVAFRLKLMLAIGLEPQLAGCAQCGATDHLAGFSGAAGGVVCEACEASAFPLDEASHRFMVDTLGRPLAQAPEATVATLRQADRCVVALAAHHAHVRLRPAAA